MLHDSLTIRKVEGKDDWGKETYSDHLYLSPCKFDRTFSNSGTGNHRNERNSSTVIVYP
ncbi:putative minor capsid protein, partial [Streptococcus pneumoniae]|uniref:putative minor capsid protein n=1 Tax=Streptococcus pneumoniae TaxID=1313 RepID=UPI0039B6FAA7